MEDLRLEQPAQAPWQGYRNPLPIPSRFLHSHDVTPPSFLGPPHNGINGNDFQPTPNRQDHPLENKGTSATGPSRSREPQTSHPSLKRSYQVFDETNYTHQPVQELNDGVQDKESRPKPTIHPDHRLLSFGQTQNRQTVFDQYGRPGIIEVSAQIHGMFFLSEIATSSGESIVIQPELTCYRRNLFQVSGSVAGPAGPLSALTDRGQTVPIVSQEVSISATESVDGHTIRLIVIPWKTPPPNSPEIPPTQEQEPPAIPVFDHADGNQDLTTDLIFHPIAWRRLQFRVATANNGRRKELQQHFVLRLSLTATLADSTKLCIAETTTAPIVVRGRSPRNFQARKEIPLIGSSASTRGHASQTSPVEKDVAQVPKSLRAHDMQSLDSIKRSFHFGDSTFSPSPLLLRQDSFNQWTTSQQASEQGTAAVSSTYISPQMVLSGYVQSSQSNLSPATLHIPTVYQPQNSVLEGRLKSDLYQPSSAYAQSVDSDPRPTKSPRHHASSGMPTLPLYASFEERLPPPNTIIPHSSDHNHNLRAYFSESLPPEAWTTSENGNVMYKYTNSMPPPPPQHYTVPSQAHIKDESQHGPYDWNHA